MTRADISMDRAKILKVGSVQMVSRNSDFAGNVSRAQVLIREAIDKGARLILLPEFALIGYLFDDPVWEEAEPLKGRTFTWLREICSASNVFIGTCILEQDGNDFFDTFILVGPGEKDFWSHRKIEPASYEAYFFKGGGLNPNVFETPIGRVGVSVCFDSSKTHSIATLRDNRPEILLITYSCPALPWFILPQDRRNWVEVYEKTAHIYTGFMQVPVVISNKTGAFDSPIPQMPLLRADAEFLGRSAIVDGGGRVLASLKEGQGVLVEEVELGPCERGGTDITEGRWFLPYGGRIRFLMDLSYRMGKLRYALSPKRRKAAVKTAGA
jgi:N-carbamoylputrescine amidase